MANEFVQTMSDARVDARSLSDFVFKPAGFKVPRRLAPPIDTLQFYIDRFDATKATTDAYVATIPGIVNDAINNTAVEGGVLADTFVTVTANGLGRIPRNLRDKMSIYVDIKDYGAIGDGTLHTIQEWIDSGRFASLAAIKAAYPHVSTINDSVDAVAIQEALNRAARVRVPDGVYLINKTINIGAHGKSLFGEDVSTYGDGNHSKTKFIHAFDGDMLVLNTQAPQTTKGRHNISGVSFISDRSKTGRAIVVNGSQNHLVNLTFFGFNDGGISIEGRSYGTYIIKPSFDRCGGGGFYDISVYTVSGNDAVDYNTLTVVADGVFESSQTGAIQIKNSDPFYLLRNYIEPFAAETTSPMIDIQNSASGNSKGWVLDNYLGSLNGNGFAISAIGASIHVKNNTSTGFKKGVYVSSQGSVVSGNILNYAEVGVQVSSVGSAVNSNYIVSENVLNAQSVNGVAPSSGVIVSGFANGGLIKGNIIRGKSEYGIRLAAAVNTMVLGNNVLMKNGESEYGIGIAEDSSSSNNTVIGNTTNFRTKYKRHSFKYDDFFLTYKGVKPTVGVWSVGDVITNPVPVAGEVYKYICTASGAGSEAVWSDYIKLPTP